MSCQNCTCGMKQIEMARTINKVEIKPIDASKIIDGSNTQILIDGQPIKNARSIEVKIGPDGLGIVKVELYAKIEMQESLVKDAEIQGEVGGIRQA